MILTLSHKRSISPLVMVRFEKFKNSLVAGNKPVLQGGLDPLSACPQAYLSASGGRTGSTWNTDQGWF